MMRRPVGTPVRELAAGKLPSDQMDHRNLRKLGRGQRRQDRREARGQEQALGDSERGITHPSWCAVPGRVPGIFAVGSRCVETTAGSRRMRDSARQHTRTLIALNSTTRCGLETRAFLAFAVRMSARAHLASFYEQWTKMKCPRVPSPRREPGPLGAAVGRADQPFAHGIGADRGRQRTGNRRQRSVKIQLADHHIVRKGVARNGPERCHQSQCDRQVEMGSLPWEDPPVPG